MKYWSVDDLDVHTVTQNCENFIEANHTVDEAFQKCRNGDLSFDYINVNGINVAKDSEPSLLLTEIPIFINEDSSRELRNALMSSGCVVVYGTSGSGKTRSILEILAHNIGFYFVTHQESLRNLGSSDMEVMNSKLKSMLSPAFPLENAKFAKRFINFSLFSLFIIDSIIVF